MMLLDCFWEPNGSQSSISRLKLGEKTACQRTLPARRRAGALGRLGVWLVAMVPSQGLEVKIVSL
ncbi:hypothetical protein DLNHIDIE_03250 [Acidithiobacillus thiooxidans ATCC 19377]|uniref:Uncharacterized protein n=1 Tax=Acidithiobacillus thiooxidans ATCC 19377 TaxID=637390 RepID=A0A543PZ88_ACITH|nr:hypothetical protein DLNHIDIE_03250 [Acidithiobacillus thiooxidans ATCC 19377]